MIILITRNALLLLPRYGRTLRMDLHSLVTAHSLNQEEIEKEKIFNYAFPHSMKVMLDGCDGRQKRQRLFLATIVPHDIST